MNVTVTDRDSEQAEKVTARVLLAADGVHSSVRQQLHPDTSFHWEGTRMFPAPQCGSHSSTARP